MDENVSEQPSGAVEPVQEPVSADTPPEPQGPEAAPPVQVGEPERDPFAELPVEKLVSHPRFQEELRRREQSAKDKTLYEWRRQQEEAQRRAQFEQLDPEDFKANYLRQQQESAVAQQAADQGRVQTMVAFGQALLQTLPDDVRPKFTDWTKFESFEAYVDAVADAKAEVKANKLVDKKLKEAREAVARDTRREVREGAPALVKGVGSGPGITFEQAAGAYARNEITDAQYAEARKQAGYT